MPPRSSFQRFLPVAALGLAVGGCGTSSRPEHPPAPRPAMPTMAASPAPPQFHLNPDEVTRAAIHLAQNGEGAAAQRAIDGAGDGPVRLRLRVAVTQALAESDPAVAAGFAAALPAGPTQASCIEIAARAWWRRDSSAALRWTLELSDPAIAGVARSTVAAEGVKANPRALMDRLMARPAEGARDDTLALAAAAWARVAVDDAVGWVQVLPAGELKERLTSSVAFEIAQSNPRRAISLAETLPAGRNRWLLFTAVAQTWVAVDPKSALAWAGGFPAGAARDAAMAGVDTGFGIPGKRRIATGPNTQTGSSRTRGGAGAAGRDWNDSGSPEFAAWVATQPLGMTGDELIIEYVRQRSAGSGGELGQWIASLPGGPTRERAMQVYVENLLPRSPDEAARWLRTLPSSDRSDALVEKLARQWLLLNPPAAEAWLQETNLPPERKEWLLRQAGR